MTSAKSPRTRGVGGRRGFICFGAREPAWGGARSALGARYLEAFPLPPRASERSWKRCKTPLCRAAALPRSPGAVARGGSSASRPGATASLRLRHPYSPIFYGFPSVKNIGLSPRVGLAVRVVANRTCLTPFNLGIQSDRMNHARLRPNGRWHPLARSHRPHRARSRAACPGARRVGSASSPRG